MTSKRINLVECVRLALGDMGVSSVSVVNAINGVLAEAEKAGHKAKLGAGSVSKKAYKVVESNSITWALPRCVVTTFDAWHSKIEAADKVAPMTGAIAIPELFKEWLLKFKTPVETPADKVEA